MKQIPQNNPIILFDGVCNLCSGIVMFTIKRDRQGIFKFTPLQSDVGQSLLKQFNLPMDSYQSFILVEGDRYYQKSTAALRVVRRMNGLCSILYVFIVLPRPIRDFIYDLIVKNSYKWFGKKEKCLIPAPGIKSRFLE
ncbi:MAG: thiol-disulfide oxidoreductase DCC family protein [Thermodesulfobacteriota bacterium]